jgi:hypothetical protein
VICAFVVHVACGEVAWAVVWPPLSFKAEYLMALVAVMGTTISPYLFFWQAGQEVEDTNEGAGARPLTRAPEQAPGEFTRIRIDTYIGMAISNLVAFFIVITTAATLNTKWRNRHPDLRTGRLDRQNACLRVCAVTRRRFPVGASPTRQPLQPEATGAGMRRSQPRAAGQKRYVERSTAWRAEGLTFLCQGDYSLSKNSW